MTRLPLISLGGALREDEKSVGWFLAVVEFDFRGRTRWPESQACAVGQRGWTARPGRCELHKQVPEVSALGVGASGYDLHERSDAGELGFVSWTLGAGYGWLPDQPRVLL